jgi:hypothetical protein
LRSTTELLDVNAKLGVATVKVDLTDITEVMAAARFAANALIGQLLAERLLGLDICPIESNLDVAISGRVSVIVRVSLATELPHLFAALRSNRVGNLAVDVVVLDGSFTEWARGRMEWSIRQRRCAEWPINSP